MSLDVKSNVAAATVRAVVAVPVALPDGRPADAELFTFNGLADAREHLAVRFRSPEPSPGPVLVRLHSECLTGDVFGSARCDCGPQLSEALTLLADTGGVILYLRQEGRGIGLYNKLDAYKLQDSGLDTYAANRKLNFGDDDRSFAVAAQMLKAMHLQTIDLITNNPVKAEHLVAAGITVARMIPTGVHLTRANLNYLKAKVDLAGHTLVLNPSVLNEE